MKGRQYQIADHPFATMYPLTGFDVSTRDGFVILKPDGLLILNIGFAWDGSSVPITKQVHALFGINYKKDKIASGEHDALYRLFRFRLVQCTPENLTIVDERYFARCVEHKMWLWRAKLRLWGLKKGGYRSTLPSSRQPVYCAP